MSKITKNPRWQYHLQVPSIEWDQVQNFMKWKNHLWKPKSFLSHLLLVGPRAEVLGLCEMSSFCFTLSLILKKAAFYPSLSKFWVFMQLKWSLCLRRKTRFCFLMPHALPSKASDDWSPVGTSSTQSRPFYFLFVLFSVCCLVTIVYLPLFRLSSGSRVHAAFLEGPSTFFFL